MEALKKAVGPLVVVALLLAGALVMLDGDDRKTVTALFPRAISVYEGSDVRVLGVPVGTVDTVTPEGTAVRVEMSYESSTDIPADATAVIVAPSIVGDRFVQLTPPYGREGASTDTLADGAELGLDRTSVPIELDQIYSSLNDLSVALGPDGANADGALTDLLESTADNFAGQGESFNQTIRDFSTLTTTLDDNKEELFGATAELGQFVETLADNDQTVRDFNQSLAQVSSVLSGEREELRSALSNLATALTEVGRFVRDNRDILTEDIAGLNDVAKILSDRRAALDEVLETAPVALNNLALTYNPEAGTLDTNANLGMLPEQILDDPSRFLCGLVEPNDPTDGGACDAIQLLVDDILQQGNNRAPFLGAGTGTSYGERFDPSLGGLVEGTR